MYLAQSVTNKRTCFQYLQYSTLQPSNPVTKELQHFVDGIQFCLWLGFMLAMYVRETVVSCNEDNCTSKIKDRKIKVQNSFQWNLMPKVIFYVSVSSAKLLWRVQSISKRTWFWWFFFFFPPPYLKENYTK